MGDLIFMVNMIIVDDEPIMIKGLSHIPWPKAHVNLVGTASNGMEALELIRNHKVHVLFTDIQMPDINGLELIRAAMLVNPSIRSVLLTGHNNFDYAREAISLRVYDYILKPCSPDEVLAIISSLADEIETELQNERQLYHTMQKVHTQQATTILTRLLENHTLDNSEISVLEHLGFYLKKSFLTVSVIGTGLQHLQTACSMLCAEDPCLDCYILTVSNTLLLLLTGMESDTDSFMRHSLLFLRQLLQTADKNGSGDISLGIGLPVSSIEELSASCQASLCCAELFFSHTEEQVLHYQKVAAMVNQYTITEITRRILGALETKNYAVVKEQLTILKQYFKSVWVTAQKIKLSMINLCFLSFSLAAQKRNEPFSGLTAEQLLLITQSQTIEDLWAQIETFLTHCIDLLTVSPHPSYHHIVQDCLHYIELHYTEEINIIKAAKEIHVNADYLSRVLKKECGCPFLQLLTKYRLEKACSLLSDANLSIGEVSSLTGFKDFRYFGQIFKNEYKMTPTEYRKTAGRNGAHYESHVKKPL